MMTLVKQQQCFGQRNLETKLKMVRRGVPDVAQWKQIRLGTMRMQVRSLPLHSGLGSGVAVSCGIGHRRGSDLVLLWLCLRPAAVPPIRSLGWEPPYAAGAALKRQKTIKKKKGQRSREMRWALRMTQVLRVWSRAHHCVAGPAATREKPFNVLIRSHNRLIPAAGAAVCSAEEPTGTQQEMTG